MDSGYPIGWYKWRAFGNGIWGYLNAQGTAGIYGAGRDATPPAMCCRAHTEETCSPVVGLLGHLPTV